MTFWLVVAVLAGTYAGWLAADRIVDVIDYLRDRRARRNENAAKGGTR